MFTCAAMLYAQTPRQLSAMPSTARIQQIQSDFLQLTRPIKFSLHEEDDWSGIDAIQRGFGARPDKATRIMLSGDAKEFQDKYSPGEIALALYPFFRDGNNDFEACVIMFGVDKTNIVYADHFENTIKSFESHQNSGDWEAKKNLITTDARHAARSDIQSHFTGWNPKAPQYQVPPDQILPSSLKKTKKIPWYLRLFR